MTVRFPTELGAVGAEGELVAGGTDIGERIRSGSVGGSLVDLNRLPGLRSIEVTASAVELGALVTLEEVARHSALGDRHPALTEACRSLATPQIRTRATMGGVLCQRTRCWYFRHPAFSCYKSGGEGCPAREGDNLHGVAFDLGPCVYPHPSSAALALLAYDGTVDTSARDGMTLPELFGDGSDPTRDHQLTAGEVLTRVRIPDPGAGRRSAYVRLMSRTWAEWPLVECAARMGVEEDAITLARVAVGGVANIPVRLPHVEDALTGARVDRDALEGAARLASKGAVVLPGGQDKRAMIRAVVLEALESALRRDAETRLPPGPGTSQYTAAP